MPNQLSEAGLTTKSVSDIVADLSAALQTIYGADVNLDQNSPDGQFVNILAQAMRDILEFATLVYASFDLDSAFGASLDRLVVLNGITRRGGTYTILPVNITVDRAVTLQGLDEEVNNPDGTGFTIADDAGNQYILQTTTVFGGAGTEELTFRAKNLGQVQAASNSVVNQVTITLGVTVVNNPSAPTTVGVDEESDVELKARHARSLQLGATGPSDAIEAALLTLPGVTDAFVPENDTAEEEDGLAPNSIWVIVEGGADVDIAKAIYNKKAPGVDMNGGTTTLVDRPNGTTYGAKFDRPINQNLWVEFSLLPKTESALFDNDLIKEQLVQALKYKLNQQATVGEVFAALQIIVPQGIPTDVGVSDDGITYEDNVLPSTFQHKFVLSIARISIT